MQNYPNRFLLFALLFGFIGLTACNDKANDQEAQKIQEELDAMRSRSQKDSLYIADLTSEMDVIYNKLDSMRGVEARIRDITAGMKGGDITPGEGGLQIDEGIAAIERQLQENRARLRELEQKLKNSESQNASLEKLVSQLRKTVEDKEADIIVLRTRITELESEVSGWKSRYSLKEDEADSLNVELDYSQGKLHTAFYVIGTERDLKQEGIVINSKRGLAPERFQSKFTKIDIREVSEIEIGTADDIKIRKVKIVPTRAENTYELVEKNNKVFIIVKDNQAFWQDKYLAIMTKTSLF
ncbi:MAG: hypothetical protein JJT94_00060 [Bernardetiaceae bacterium]|nr:hypothetical protein [Bernardetiaceae bacterium]